MSCGSDRDGWVDDSYQQCVRARGSTLSGLLGVICVLGIIGWTLWLAGQDAPAIEKPVDRPRPCLSY